VEEMHTRQPKHKLATRALQRQGYSENAATTPKAPDSGAQGGQNTGNKAAGSSLLAKKPKGRPSTPDLVGDASGELKDDKLPMTAACVLLQRLLRGRAIQNTMYEGRLRRKELIAELRDVDMLCEQQGPKHYSEVEAARQKERAAKIRETTVDAIVGSSVASILSTLAVEHVRNLISVSVQLFVFGD
jgi:hypothetical protein